MAEEDLAALENQGLKKKFNLTSAINLSNMVSSILINISLSVNSKMYKYKRTRPGASCSKPV